MYVLTLRTVISTGVAVAACGYALVRGRGPERVGAAAYGANWALTPAVQIYPLAQLQWGVLGLDLAAAAVLLAIALRANRWWPLLAAAFALLIPVEHLGYAIAPRGLARAYFAGEAIWSYAILLALVAGTAVEAGGARRLSAATSAGFGPAPRPPGRATP